MGARTLTPDEAIVTELYMESEISKARERTGATLETGGARAIELVVECRCCRCLRRAAMSERRPRRGFFRPPVHRMPI